MQLTNTNKVIELQNVTVKYGRFEAVSDITCSVYKGDYIGLVGPNGGGKSTIAKAILRLIPISSGTIALLGQPLAEFSDWQKVDYLPQNIHKINLLFPASVEEVIFTGLLSSKKFPKVSNKKDKEIIQETLGKLGIGDLKNKMLNDLSGGQQQKVMLARALVSSPEILIFDEPTAALDPNSRETFYKLVEKLNKGKGITIIVITHDTTQIGKYANKLLYVDKKLIFYGNFSDFCKSAGMNNFFGEHGHHAVYHQHDK